MVYVLQAWLLYRDVLANGFKVGSQAVLDS